MRDTGEYESTSTVVYVGWKVRETVPDTQTYVYHMHMYTNSSHGAETSSRIHNIFGKNGEAKMRFWALQQQRRTNELGSSMEGAQRTEMEDYYSFSTALM